MRKHVFAAAAVTAALLGAVGTVPAVALADGYGNVTAEKSGNTVTIGNDAISRTFSVEGNKLKTTLIDNKLGKTKLVPGAGSEEFVIGSLKPVVMKEPTDGQLHSVKPNGGSSVTATVKASSEEPNDNGSHPANLAVDGKADTYWASQGNTDEPWFELDFGKDVNVKTIKLTSRNGGADHGYQCTGQIKKVKVQKWDGSNWAEVKEFTLTSGKQDGEHTLELDAPVTTSKVRLLVTDSYYWNHSSEPNKKFANIAEVDVLNEQNKSVLKETAASWSVEANSTETGDGNGPAALIDGQDNTYWHSRYNNNGTGEQGLPVTVTIDRGAKGTSFQSVMYRSRPANNGAPGNGAWLEFEVYASNDKSKLFEDANRLKTESGSKTFKANYSGMTLNGSTGMKDLYFGLQEACDKQFVGFKVTKGQGGNFASGAEIDLMAEKFTSVENPEGDALGTSEMTLADTKIEDVNHTINEKKKHGKLVTFTFQPAEFGQAHLTIKQKVAMYDGDHFMRKWLEISSDNDEERINYIDGEHLNLDSAKSTWTIPTNAGGIVAMDTSRANLGQPFYTEGMFFGSEFPETDTQIVEDGNVNKMGRSRYWTGKNFGDFKRDHQLTTGNEYVSWQTVCGATHASDNDMNVIQTDFFAYINSISKPSDFRIQYNSWFDNMMFIDDKNIIDSFLAVDKNLSETGVRPLESYVVDDGWNQYRKTAGQLATGDDLRRNGSTDEPNGVNHSGFWQFNNKFPQGLTPSSQLVQKLGSNFGVWIGPRGGYNYQGNLASIISEAGKGSSAGGSIDVADQRYVDNFEAMALKWMEDYGVNYWKWDGFADNGQYGAFKQGEGVVGYDENHHHMYGGPNGFYHSTDLWEKWIKLFDAVWDKASEEQINKLWISLTCYVNPSPWFLQWSNSVWIQCVGDRGEVRNGQMNDKMNAMLTYRDACYYDFIVNHQFQFPLANLYNHDPIYGKEGTGIDANSMNGHEFRNYLYMMGARGTAFWELYYSDSLFDDEKYLVNADFLKWEEENFPMLRNAKWIGGTPSSSTGLSSGTQTDQPGTQNAYGFSGFNSAGNEGIISLRNPDKVAKTITFTLNEGMGCKESGSYRVVVDHAFIKDGELTEAPKTLSKGQEFSIQLKPGETQIWHLSKKGDTVAPTLSELYAPENTVLRVQASEHVYGAQFEVYVNGEKVELGDNAVKAYADLKTFDITLPKAPANGATVKVKAVSGKDAAGNKLANEAERTFHTNGIVAQSAEPVCTKLASKDQSVKGTNGFAVQASMTDAKPGTLVSQGDQWSLSIDGEGKAVFTVNGVSAKSEQAVSGLVSVAGVRENNGMLKVYVDGQIAGNAYDAKKTLGFDVKPATIKVSKDASIIASSVYDRSLGYDEVSGNPLADVIKQAEALKPVVSVESWNAAGMDEVIANAKQALAGTDAAAKKSAYDALKAAVDALVPGQGPVKVVNLAKGIAPTAGWLKGETTPADQAVDSGSPLSKATDEVVDTNSYGIFGNDDVAKPAYMQIDLGSEAVIQDVQLWRYWNQSREYADTALVVSNDPKFEDESTKVLYYSSVDDEMNDVFKLGVNPTERTYAESADGKKIFDGASKPASARYIRLYGNGYKTGIGKENHVVELKVMGYKAAKPSDPFNLADFEALLSRAEDAIAHADKYDAKSLEAVKKAYEPAKKVYEKAKAETESGTFTLTYGEVNGPREKLRSALNCLMTVEGEIVPIEPSKPVYPLTPIEPSKPVENPQGGNGAVKPNGEQKPAKPNKPSEGNLAQTGDNAYATIALVSCAGIVLLGAGILASKRRMN